MPSDTCTLCGCDFTDRMRINIKQKLFCDVCYNEKMRAKRIERANLKREDILEKRHREMRRAIDERDKYRRERDRVKEDIRAGVENGIRDEIRQLPFVRRLGLLFNPFAWGVR